MEVNGVCDIFQNEELYRICRVQLIRSVPSVIQSQSIVQVEVTCASEFNERVDTQLVGSVTYLLNLTRKIINQTECSSINYKAIKSNGSTATSKLRFSAPQEAGSYTLTISACATNEAWIVIPLMTETFEVCDSVLFERKWKGQYIPKLLGCYRTIQCRNKTVTVKEEYGNTLGSHIYDSSIVILRYISSLSTCEFVSLLNRYGMKEQKKPYAGTATTTSTANSSGTNNVNIVELGAGCGLVGLWIAKYLKDRQPSICDTDNNAASIPAVNYNIHLTDKNAQLPLLLQNTQVNSFNTTKQSNNILSIQCNELDWSNEIQINSYKSAFHEESVRLIVAGDVFYSRDAAVLLAHVIHKLSTPGVTQVLVAQKLRLNHENMPVALITVKELKSLFYFATVELVREEADVLVWLILPIELQQQQA